MVRTSLEFRVFACLRWRSALTSQSPAFSLLSNHRRVSSMLTRIGIPLVAVAFFLQTAALSAQEKKKLYLDPINVKIPHISTDKTVKYDYDIVYVRAKRTGDQVHKRFFSDFSTPVTL